MGVGVITGCIGAGGGGITGGCCSIGLPVAAEVDTLGIDGDEGGGENSGDNNASCRACAC